MFYFSKNYVYQSFSLCLNNTYWHETFLFLAIRFNQKKKFKKFKITKKITLIFLVSHFPKISQTFSVHFKFSVNLYFYWFQIISTWDIFVLVMFFISCLKAEISCFHSSLLNKPENKGFCVFFHQSCFIYAYYVHHTITTPIPVFSTKKFSYLLSFTETMDIYISRSTFLYYLDINIEIFDIN